MACGAIIVTFNPDLSDLKLLFENICASVEKIVIVDNASNNIGAITCLAAEFNGADIFSLPENMGIGYAQNRGIKALLAISSINEIILFDHDSHPAENMISTLLLQREQLEKNGVSVGAVGPGFIDPRTRNRYPIPFFKGFKLYKIYPDALSTTPVLTSFLIASGCLIARRVLEDVGLMNEAFFIDYIDIEWSFRVGTKGYSLYTCPDALMFHKVGDSRLKVFGREISIHSPLRRYYLARNSVLMMRTKHIGWQYKLRESIYTISRVVVFVIFVHRRGTYLKFILKGWYHGLLGKTGRYK